MFSQRIRQVMGREKLLSAPPNTTVADAARQMAGQQVGAVVIVEGEQVTGIFTERDAVFRVIAAHRDPQVTTLAEVMTAPPVTAHPDRDFGFALSLMHEHGCRHVPVVEDGRLVGIVSARDALDPEMEDFICEAQRRKHLR